MAKTNGSSCSSLLAKSSVSGVRHSSDLRLDELGLKYLNVNDKLKQTLDEMEQKEIIRKSSSEFASTLVLVWKKNGNFRLCTDFRWLNARTLRDAHPLPHQADVLAALGGKCFV